MSEFDQNYSNQYPEQQNGPQSDQQFPSGPMDEHRSNDLLSQISAEDEKDELARQNKSSHSFTMQFVIFFMKLTFILDEAKRHNQKIFDLFSVIWGAILTVIYLGGFFVLGLLIYSYVKFPELVKDNLIRQNILAKDYKIDNYSFSRIELHDLEDKDGAYSIEKMIIHSTFSDFINRRVKSVILDGVKIKIKTTKNGLELGTLPKGLLTINHPSASGRQMRVDSISLTRATLEIDGMDYKLPISFSLTGLYEKGSEITIPLSIREKEINMVGKLNIVGTQREMTFTLEIASGTLTIPRRSPENLSGDIKLVTQNMKPTELTGNINLTYGQNAKKFKLDFKKNNDQLYAGSVNVSVLNADPKDSSKEIRTNASVNFVGIDFKSFQQFTTTKPVRVTVQSFKNQEASFSDLTTTLNGKMTCTNLDCTYRLNRAASVWVRDSSIVFNSDNFKSAGEYSFSLVPNGKDTFIWKNRVLTYDLALQGLSFIGHRNSAIAPVKISAAKAGVKGSYSFSKVAQFMAVDIQKFDVSTPDFSMSNGTYKNANIFDDKAVIQLTADQVKFVENDIVKAPFKVSLDKKGLDTKAVISLENNTIRASFSGISRLLTGEFRGNIFVHEFDLAKVKTPLDQLSSLFPPLTKPQGYVAALGSIYWKNSKQVTGPVYVSLRDVGFKIGNLDVIGLNSVLTLQNIEPLTTPSNQRVFIKQTKGAVPLQNITAEFKLDNQFVRLSEATAYLAGIQLKADPVVVPVKATSSTVYFKNNAVDWAQANAYLDMAGAVISGKGSILLPIELKSTGAFVKNAEIKIFNADMGLEKTRGTKVSLYLNNANSYYIRTGTVLLNTDETSKNTNLNISFDGRLIPGQQIKNIRETVDVPLAVVVKPVPAQKVPEDIVKKQQIIVK